MSSNMMQIIISRVCQFAFIASIQLASQANGQASSRQVCKTERGCTCKSLWNYKGVDASSCGNPDKDVYGSWCVIEEQGASQNCSPLWKVDSTGEFWDRCQCTTQAINKGCVTQGGCVCKDKWMYKDREVSACGNPDGDVVGNWCVIDASKSQNCNHLSVVNSTGEPWDRCSCFNEDGFVEEAAVIENPAGITFHVSIQQTPKQNLEGCRAPEAIWCDVEFLRAFKMNMPSIAKIELATWVDGTKSLAPTNPCGSQPWKGITCSQVGQGNNYRVTKISLGMYDWKYNWADGRWAFEWASSRAVPASQLPRDLSKVAYLEEFEAAYTFIDAQLPVEISELKHLKVLDISGNSVQGNDAGVKGTLPPQFSILTALSVFYAFQNKLTGTIPAEYSTLTNLDHFSVSNNRLTGPIPPQLSSVRGELWLRSEIPQGGLCVPDQETKDLIMVTTFKTDIDSIPFC